MGQESLHCRNEEVVKAVGGFGGGIAISGSVCGILLGGIALLSSLYGKGRADERENQRLWQVSKAFLEEFERLAEPFGGMNCSDIAKVDWENKLEVLNYYKNPLSSARTCTRLVGEAAFRLGQLLDRERQDGFL